MFLVQPIVFGKSQDDTDNNIANDWTKRYSMFYNSWHVKYFLVIESLWTNYIFSWTIFYITIDCYRYEFPLKFHTKTQFHNTFTLIRLRYNPIYFMQN